MWYSLGLLLFELDRVLQEIQFVDGSYGASSKYSSTDKVEDAFKHRVDAFLHTGRDAFGNGDRTFPFPHLIWYNFPSAVLPGRVSFRPRHSPECGDRGFWCGATKWQFIGTNDEVPLWARIEKKHRTNSHPIIHYPTSSGVIEVSEQASEWAQWSAQAKQAVWSKWMGEQCERTDSWLFYTIVRSCL